MLWGRKRDHAFEEWIPQPLTEQLKDLRERFNRLANRNPHIFGAEGHRFRLNPPLTTAEVIKFEEQHRVTLPMDYRAFVVSMGDGGAGPAHGIFRLGEMDSTTPRFKRWSERDGFVGVLSEPFPHSDAWNDLTGKPVLDDSREDDQEYEDQYWEQLDKWEELHYFRSDRVNGAIPVCHLGCALRCWLVVTGAEAGHIWQDDRADEGGLHPLQQNGRDRVSFIQWYSDWLDESLAAGS